jgi:hypothetical protein
MTARSTGKEAHPRPTDRRTSTEATSSETRLDRSCSIARTEPLNNEDPVEVTTPAHVQQGTPACLLSSLLHTCRPRLLAVSQSNVSDEDTSTPDNHAPKTRVTSTVTRRSACIANHASPVEASLLTATSSTHHHTAALDPLWHWLSSLRPLVVSYGDEAAALLAAGCPGAKVARALMPVQRTHSVRAITDTATTTNEQVRRDLIVAPSQSSQGPN